MLHLPQIRKTSIQAELQVPVSKSMANRYLLMKALSGTEKSIDFPGASADVQILQKALLQKEGPVNFNDAGTPLRLFLAYAALTGYRGLIDGNARLRERPIAPLLIALEQLGAGFKFIDQAYRLPLEITKAADRSKTEVEIDYALSSQFVSALMLIAPCFENGLQIKLKGQSNSEPYIQLSKDLMEKAGIQIEKQGDDWRVFRGQYFLNKIDLESDWSSACFIYAWIACSSKAEIILPGLSLKSSQGDAYAASLFSAFGVQTSEIPGGIKLNKVEETHFPEKLDFKNHPDLFPVICALSALKKIPVQLSGLENLKHKESDRLEAMKRNLQICGVHFKTVSQDCIRLEYHMPEPGPYHFQAFNDHRIAMACSLFAFENEIEIDDEKVVAKSFPEYWTIFKQTFNL